jgi:hypothetical protein
MGLSGDMCQVRGQPGGRPSICECVGVRFSNWTQADALHQLQQYEPSRCRHIDDPQRRAYDPSASARNRCRHLVPRARCTIAERQQMACARSRAYRALAAHASAGVRVGARARVCDPGGLRDCGRWRFMMLRGSSIVASTLTTSAPPTMRRSFCRNSSSLCTHHAHMHDAMAREWRGSPFPFM